MDSIRCKSENVLNGAFFKKITKLQYHLIWSFTLLFADFLSLFQASFPLFPHWCLLFLPYQSLSHYRSLLDFFTHLTLYRSVTAQSKVYLLNLLYLVYILLNVYLWWFLPPPLSRLRQVDAVSVIVQTDAFYLPNIGLASVELYYIDVLCFTMKAPFLRLLEDILFKDRNGTLEGVGYGAKSGQVTARHLFLSLANLLQLIVLAYSKFRDSLLSL